MSRDGGMGGSGPVQDRSGERVALVTGGARRIGEAIVRELHARGCRVLVHYHGSEAEANTLLGTLNNERPGSAALLKADLAGDDGPQNLAEQVMAQSPCLDLLVNNASRFYPTPLGEVTPRTWKDLMGSNVRGAFFLSQALIPALEGGAIVNILDVYADRPLRGHTVYCMAKSALVMMTRSMALELGPSIRVNGVAPGAILWPEHEPAEGEREGILSRTAMGRLGSPGDIASAVAFLGLEATYVTGQVLAVDGGRSLNM